MPTIIMSWQGSAARRPSPSDHSGSKSIKRRSHAKVKTGCKTCRIKCDEQKPSCHKCIKNRFSCEWFATPLPRDTKQDATYPPSHPPLLPRGKDQTKANAPPLPGRVPIQPLANWNAKALNLDPTSPPASNFLQTDLEHRYFRVFCEKVTTQLAGFVDSSIWNQLVLQASEQNDAIRHAIIAVGALDITLQASKATTQVDPMVAMDEHHRFAITQYSKAITKMRISISENQHNLRTTLLTVLLIICFECLHGNHESAIAQMKSSLDMLENWLGSQKPLPIDAACESHLSGHKYDASTFVLRSPAPDIIEDELVQAFARLDMQAASYTDSRPISYHRAFKDFGADLIEKLPTRFSSLDEATMYWELIMRRLMHFITASLAMNCEDEVEDIREAGPGGKSGILNTNNIRPRKVGQSVSSHTPNNYSLSMHESRHFPMAKPLCKFAILNSDPSLINEPCRTSQNVRPAQMINTYGRSFLTEHHPSDLRDSSEPGLRFGGMLNPHIQTKDHSPAHLMEQRMHLDECIRWANAYTALRKKLVLGQESPDYIHAIFLWLRYKTGYIALSCSQSANQLVYDAYLDDFRQIVQIAKVLHAQPSNTAVFTFDLRYIPQLYFTAIRCRNRVVRRQAIGILLARPYREGVWDSLVAGKMATTVMEIEEEGLVGDHIPEEKRVRGTMMEFNLVRRSGRLKCFLCNKDGIIIKQRDIQW